MHVAASRVIEECCLFCSVGAVVLVASHRELQRIDLRRHVARRYLIASPSSSPVINNQTTCLSVSLSLSLSLFLFLSNDDFFQVLFSLFSVCF